jgi:hypothetical protein
MVSGTADEFWICNVPSAVFTLASVAAIVRLDEPLPDTPIPLAVSVLDVTVRVMGYGCAGGIPTPTCAAALSVVERADPLHLAFNALDRTRPDLKISGYRKHPLLGPELRTDVEKAGGRARPVRGG